MATITRQASPLPLAWNIDQQPQETIVEFRGEIDENVDFSELRRHLKGSVVFHLGSVRRINSCGVREWVNFVRNLPNVRTLEFTHCSPVTVTQLNMIYNFRGPAYIRSFYAPYVCENCDHEEEKLLDTKSQFAGGDLQAAPNFVCEECNEPLEFDDIPERYFAFLLNS